VKRLSRGCGVGRRVVEKGLCCPFFLFEGGLGDFADI